MYNGVFPLSNLPGLFWLGLFWWGSREGACVRLQTKNRNVNPFTESPSMRWPLSALDVRYGHMYCVSNVFGEERMKPIDSWILVRYVGGRSVR